ncbi:MAG: LysM peptidoglycan-binding domain-containing protein, partial [Oscillospiraceae bacterium]|nr:LysM peptidoglycan-binding domain-containing protein [Oscillospiraceae bacterium]
AVPVRFALERGSIPCGRAICAISYDDSGSPSQDGAPSLTVTRARPGEKLWSVAKRHGSSVRLIMDANSMERESDMAPGALLLVPRFQ